MDNKNLIEEDNQSGRKKYYKKVDRALMFSILFVTFGVLISVVISSIFYGNGIINQIQDTNDSLKVESARVWPDGTVTDSDHLPKRYAVPYGFSFFFFLFSFFFLLCTYLSFLPLFAFYLFFIHFFYLF